MNKKYELTDETKIAYPKRESIVVYRIKAERDIPAHSVKKGDFGGWIETEENLSQIGDSWIDPNGCVTGIAHIQGNKKCDYNWHSFAQVIPS